MLPPSNCGLPPPLIYQLKSVGCAAKPDQGLTQLEKQSKLTPPAFKKWAFDSWTSRLWQSPWWKHTVPCHRNTRDSWGEGVPWALTTGTWAPGTIPYLILFAALKKHASYIQNPASKGNEVFSTSTDCDLLLHGCGRQPGTAQGCESCFQNRSFNVT